MASDLGLGASLDSMFTGPVCLQAEQKPTRTANTTS